MAKPKLALIPAAQGSKLFSVLPSSGVGDFDFTRSGSATRINSQGLIETVDDGVSRLNYPMIDGKVVGCPHHILEPQRTNLVTYSEDFSNAAWGKSNSSIVSDSTISPDGTLNSDKLVINTSAGYLGGTFISSGNTDVTVSFFVKSDTLSSFTFAESFYFGTITSFDLSSGTTDNGKIENYGNGWYRCSKTYTYASGQQIVAIQIKTGAVGSLYIFGGQYEEGSFPTSYIKSNSGSATTRSAETANGSGDAATFNDSEGVLMVETKGENDGTFNYISLSDGGTQNYAGILYTDEDSQITYRYYVGGSGVQIIIENIIVTNFNKIAIKYKANDFAIWINGIEVGTASSGSLNPSGTFNQLAFARGGANNTPFYGNTKQLQYYNSALTDSELEQLTSWTSFSDMAEGQQYSIQ